MGKYYDCTGRCQVVVGRAEYKRTQFDGYICCPFPPWSALSLKPNALCKASAIRHSIPVRMSNLRVVRLSAFLVVLPTTLVTKCHPMKGAHIRICFCSVAAVTVLISQFRSCALTGQRIPNALERSTSVCERFIRKQGRLMSRNTKDTLTMNTLGKPQLFSVS